MNAFSRMQMLSKLKYIGVATEDLIQIYCLFIRSVLEYCSMAFHSSLTKQQSDYLESIQTCSLKVILGPVDFISPSAAREMCGLSSLLERRDRRLSSYVRKCIKHEKHSKLFPLQTQSEYSLREQDKYVVNFAHTQSYQNSTIIACQKRLNELSKLSKA